MKRYNYHYLISYESDKGNGAIGVRMLKPIEKILTTQNGVSELLDYIKKESHVKINKITITNYKLLVKTRRSI